MEKKKIPYIIKGISQDTSISKSSTEYAFDALNIRISLDRGTNLLSIKNEQGNKVQLIHGDQISGKVIGVYNSDSLLVLITTEKGGNYCEYHKTLHPSKDRVYKITLNGDELHSKIIYNGYLNLSEDSWAETIGIKESEFLYPIYWVDGINPLRKVNAMHFQEQASLGKEAKVLGCEDSNKVESLDSFDYNEEVSITPSNDSVSLFSSGVVQYVMTYFNLNGRESSPFYYSPIHYLTKTEFGGEPGERVSSAFHIRVINLNTDYDYVRVYSVVRTTLNGTAIVSKVKDAPTRMALDFIDRNGTTEEVDSTHLLFLASNNLIPYTFAQKDNRLFMGNYYHKDGDKEHESPPSLISAGSFIDTSKEQTLGKYPLSNLHQENVSYFKQNESYYLGVVFRKKDGTYSDVYPLKRVISEHSYLQADDDRVNLSSLVARISNIDNDYVVAIPVIKVDDRTRSIATGFLNPTMYKVSDRLDGSPYAYTSWFVRPNVAYKPHEAYNLTSTNKDDKGILTDELPIGNAEYRHGYFLPMAASLNAEFASSKPHGYYGYPRTHYEESAKLLPQDWVVDRRTVTLHSSSFEKENRANISEGKLKVRILGVLPITDYGHSMTFEDTGESHKYSGSELGRNLDGWRKSLTIDNEIKTILTTPSYNSYVIGSEILNFGGAGSSEGVQGVNIESFSVYALDGTYDYYGSRGYTVPNYLNPNTLESAFPFYNFLIYPFHHSGPITGNEGPRVRTKKIVNFKRTSTPVLFDESIDIEVDGAVIEPENRGYGYLVDGKLRQIRSYVDNVTTGVDNINPYRFPAGTYPIYGARFGHNVFHDIFNEDSNQSETDFADNALIARSYHRSAGSRLHTNLVTIDYNKSFHNRSHEILLGYDYNSQTKDYYLSKGGDKNVWVATIVSEANRKIKETDYRKFDIHSQDRESSYYGIFPTSSKKVYHDNATNRANAGIQIKYKNARNVTFSMDRYLPNHLYRIGDTLSSKDYSILSVYNLATSGNLKGFFMSAMYGRNDRKGVINKYFGDVTLDDTVSEQTLKDKYFYRLSLLLGLGAGYTDADVMRAVDGLMGENNLSPDDFPMYGAWSPVLSFDAISGVNDPMMDISKDIAGSTFNPMKSDYLFYAELYNDVDYDDNFDLVPTQWYIAGPQVKTSGITELKYTSGNFYLGEVLQIITNSISSNQTNNVVEVMRYFEESSYNLHGYVGARHLIEDLDSFNSETKIKYNDVYSQMPNYKLMNKLPRHIERNVSYSSGVVWSRQKVYNSLTDPWLNITGYSNYDLEGNKGALMKLVANKSNLIAFQESGIAALLFNPRVQIQTSDNIPIEIGNTMKMEGHRYISEKIGCQNKWSMVSTDHSIYFVDSFNSAIYALGEQLNPLSDKHGFRWYIENHSSPIPADKDKNNFIGSYEEKESRVYFSNGENALCYNEFLGSFESFLSYNSMRTMINMGNNLYSMQRDLPMVWKHYSNNYGYYYGKRSNWYISYNVNPSNGFADVLFSNFEMRADSYDANGLMKTLDFNSIEVKTEHQIGSHDLRYEYSKGNITKKFNTWRGELPRDNKYKLNRIRNPYSTITIYGNNFFDTIVHNIAFTVYG